ncbi:MAG: hypothetical protein HKO07_01715, partial [Pseudomonadales bacterium]|nr:hypothetical protein [Pseudomonadales bacterium]
FTLVAYAQLLIENWQKKDIHNDLMDQIFDFMVRDFSKYALQLYSKTSSTRLQQIFGKRMLRKPVVDEQRFNRVLHEFVYAKKGSYTMNPGSGSVVDGSDDKVHAIA